MLIVSVLLALLPEVSVTELCESEQVPAAVPPAFVTAQVSCTPPAKPFCDVTVMLSVLPVAAPAVTVSFVEAGTTVKLGVLAPTVTTIVADVTTVVPLVPVTVTFRVPVPVVLVMDRVLVPLPPALKVAEVGDSEQLPAADPLELVTAQVSATVPEKLFTDARVIVSVLPVFAPAVKESVVEVGVTVKVGVVTAAAAFRKLRTSSEPRPVTSS